MRCVKLTGLLALVLTGACHVQVGDGGGGGGGNQPRAPQQQARGPAAPPRSAPRTAPRTAPRAAPRGAPAPAPAPPPQNNAVQPQPSGGGLNRSQIRVMDQGLNIQKVQAIKARNPKACGYMEMSPGNWVHVDCKEYAPSVKSVSHLSTRKAKLVNQRKVLRRPLGRRAAPAVGAGPAVGGPVQIGDDVPGSVDHRADRLEGPIKNQGGVGSCTAHSLSSALDNAAIRAGNLQPGDRDRMTSPLHVWSRYGLPDMGAAADGNIAQPVGIFTTWPQSDKEACQMFQDTGGFADECGEAYNVKPGSWRSNPTLMAKYNKSQAEGIYKISSIEKLQTRPPNMEELTGILATGSDIWAAFLIDGYAWSNSRMKNGVIQDYADRSGGHAVVISGYRDVGGKKQFLIHNSWGESWGENGYAWVTEATVNKWLYYAYKVKITNGVPKEDLTDDDCAPDELIDMTTGLCAIICPDDSRPNNGCKK